MLYFYFLRLQMFNILSFKLSSVCFMNMKQRWYLCINKNIKERVNFINFVPEFESVYFDRSCQKRAFNIWNTRNANLQNYMMGDYCRSGRGVDIYKPHSFGWPINNVIWEPILAISCLVKRVVPFTFNCFYLFLSLQSYETITGVTSNDKTW